MLEVDIDDSGTVDFFEFLCVARLISQGKGTSKASSVLGRKYTCKSRFMQRVNSRENKGTESETPSTALGICEFQLS